MIQRVVILQVGVAVLSVGVAVLPVGVAVLPVGVVMAVEMVVSGHCQVVVKVRRWRLWTVQVTNQILISMTRTWHMAKYGEEGDEAQMVQILTGKSLSH